MPCKNPFDFRYIVQVMVNAVIPENRIRMLAPVTLKARKRLDFLGRLAVALLVES
jgi:hypothetical protein